MPKARMGQKWQSYLQEWPDIQDGLVHVLTDVLEACLSISAVSLMTAAAALLWQGFQNGIHFFSYSSKRKLKLVLCTH